MLWINERFELYVIQFIEVYILEVQWHLGRTDRTFVLLSIYIYMNDYINYADSLFFTNTTVRRVNYKVYHLRI